MVNGQALNARPFRAALIGLGNIAWKYDAARSDVSLTHRSAYARNMRTELCIGFDADAAQRALFAEQTGVSTTNTLDALLDSRPDIVSICSPNGLHAEHLRACLVARVPMVWLEKPATTSAKDANDLLDLQRMLGSTTVLVGFQRRYQQAYQRLKTLLIERSLGECIGISLTYSRGLETNGVHLVDLLFYLLGETVDYEISGVTPANGPMASPSFLLRFDLGIDCVATGLPLDHHSIDVTVHFSAGRASVLYGGATSVTERRIENPLFPGFFRLAVDTGETGGIEQLGDDAGAVMPRMLDDLIAAHEAGVAPMSNLETAVKSQTLVERLLAQAGKR
jgi:predicted dehydrogenase